MEHQGLRRVPEIHRPGGHHQLLHRRGVDGRDKLPGDLRPQRPGPGHEDHPGRAGDHGHHRHGGHRAQPVPVQDRHGHLGQAHPGGQKRRPHRPADGKELPPEPLDPPAPHRLLAGGARHRQEAGGRGNVHHGGRGPVLSGRACGLL